MGWGFGIRPNPQIIKFMHILNIYINKTQKIFLIQQLIKPTNNPPPIKKQIK